MNSDRIIADRFGPLVRDQLRRRGPLFIFTVSHAQQLHIIS